MAENYKEYLAAKVLTDGRPVTYRLLSRALKTNVNVAKSMLYDFYTKQNAKKPKSVHATYILVGRKREAEQTHGANGSHKNGEDSFMHSSPFMSSLPEPEAEPVDEEAAQKTTMVLVREEELEATKAEFEEITSTHIYSLEPGPIENLNVLSVCNQEIATKYSSGDPLERWKHYGSIHNPYIKRRTAKFAPPPAAAASASKAPAKPTAAMSAKEKEKAGLERRGSVSDANTLGRSTPQPTSASNTIKKSDSKPSLKRDKSDIFKSFAKSKPKAKEAEKSKESTPAPAADEPMQAMSEDEGEDDTPVVQVDQEQQEAARRKRQERQDKLRKMMDEPEDEEMPDAPSEEENDSQDAAIDKIPVPKPTQSESALTSQGGRRRGRRKVMKKKTVKDEEGYLVTKEEAVWESFSEDEPEPKKPKPTPKPMSAAKGKNGGKKAQGSIANFFKKA
ncbi:DNA polymerase subunit Cdc27 [Lophiotrema nucula]|uniref:DNA polymerase delta subunit 3 n=1 Tax=Lophiotrema nucula TaxID=690887 RepID=A0A6A5ZRN8_9PLEO|nr:DNA polymerase subunit Cdc27 [Lophiotrema nucula]